MIRKKMNELKGNEILGKPLMTLDYQIILPEGAQLRPEYLEKMIELGVTDAWVLEQDFVEENALEILKDNILSTVNQKVKDILERHTYQNNEELEELCIAVENVMQYILEDENVLEAILEIRQRSSDLYEHSVRVCTFSLLTALKLKMDKMAIHNIGIGSLLHDIGMRYSVIDVFGTDMFGMSADSWAEYKKHPVYGYDALKNEKWLSDISRGIILFHHETLDGEGYPIKTGDISKECRIVSICDTFDEMYGGIGYTRAKLYEVIEYLKNYKNVKYDAKMVDTFLSLIAVYPTGTRVVTNEGEEAIVVRQNSGFQERPVLRITHNQMGEEVTGIVIKDLVKVHNIFIDKVLD